MIRYEPVLPPTASNIERDGFVAAYKQAFGGPPYFEEYSDAEVIEEVWSPHIRDGIVILARDGHRVIGFGCAMPLKSSPDDVQGFLQGFDVETFPAVPENTWYMSELGVLSSHRLRGIGYQLVRHRLISIDHRRGTHYVFRTASEGSNSIHLYRKIGATELPDLQHICSTPNGTQSNSRVYLYGTCNEALQQLAQVA